MKKIIVLLSALLLCTVTLAQERIIFSLSEVNENPIGHSQPKSPIQSPTVYIDDYTLAFVADHPEYILNIKDEDGDVVYTTVVYSSLTQVVLPSTLSGGYQIELLMGNWIFTGYINL